ncbi:hypothetical protein GCK72_014414 [Caenorhabditis remanei]|uniref:H/ACA ribonucleoprotein complex non-core subunit NAF1 n=1 Tax=Caenorhabditis remanei TaxID=31234 RepID=A0A6A5GTN2_CAERE|nr:hypothetical protein GCK72_014414 [Caenorhabditis remanei]KAF1757956.1 hypothetical protein GCK72_014414 [Caenorhabditis remanei]
MSEDNVKIEDPDDFMTIDRTPVPLAFCAHPTPIATEIVKKEAGIAEQLFELVDPIIVGNPNEIRQAPSIKSYGCDTESEFEFSDDDSDFENIKDIRSGALDSDEEFDKIVKFSAKIIEKTHKSEYPENVETKKNRKSKNTHKTANVREYDDLPPLENLSIECKSNLLEFGFVTKVVDCQVVIVSTCNEVLDFDSYLFDQKGNAIGQIYDIFGQVKTPQYVIRFNSSEEASLMPIDMKVFYAPAEEQYSKTPFKGLNLAAANREAIKSLNRRLDQQAAVEKAVDHIHVADVDSDVEFSDDEAEKEYRKNKQTVPMNQRHQNEANRGGRKRDRRGGQKVQFAAGNTATNPLAANTSAPKPYRRDHDGPAPDARPPQTTDSNPYAEFGCHSGFNGRFGI